MVFLIALGIVGLIGVAATVHALRTDGYRAIRARDTAGDRARAAGAAERTRALVALEAVAAFGPGPVAQSEQRIDADVPALLVTFDRRTTSTRK
ncbi:MULTISPECIES: hypothetical protein [Subtercola]|uniref:hypothetical protein n=1 Tax=Subtercola TaxID=120212 RepID=UPI0010A9AD12|nr:MULTISPECIES: hypothetical protein [Subtercola]MEA9986649.1 hypothetical protein [Subtercola sp. RTI3]